MITHNILAIDLAKNVFQVCSMNQHQKLVFNKQVKRKDLSAMIAKQPTSGIAMEACYSSHYWGRRFESMGHTVRLLPAQPSIVLDDLALASSPKYFR